MEKNPKNYQSENVAVKRLSICRGILPASRKPGRHQLQGSSEQTGPIRPVHAVTPATSSQGNGACPPSLDLRCESLFVDSTSPPTTTSVLTKTGKTEMRHLTDLENSRSRKTPVSRNKGCSKKSSVATMGDVFFSAAGRDVLAALHSKHAA